MQRIDRTPSPATCSSQRSTSTTETGSPGPGLSNPGRLQRANYDSITQRGIIGTLVGDLKSSQPWELRFASFPPYHKSPHLVLCVAIAAFRDRTVHSLRVEEGLLFKLHPLMIDTVSEIEKGLSMSQHLVLLGDSILDNAAYVPGRRPAVIDQLRNRLPKGWLATLLARDGSVIDDVYRQLDALPHDATHLVLSVGGNDALSEVGTLRKTVTTVGQGLRVLAEVCERFEGDYRRLLATIRDRHLPAAVCAVYNPAIHDPVTRREVVAALGLYNDGIIRVAREFKFPVLELRVICTDAADFVAQIEPSLHGGAKIAEAICQTFVVHNFGTRQTVIFP
jgi:hypothetical protein